MQDAFVIAVEQQARFVTFVFGFVFALCLCLCLYLCLFRAASQVCDLCVWCLCLCLAANQVCDLCVEDDAVLDTSRVTGSDVRVDNNVTILSFSLRLICTRSSFWGANDIVINISITID